MAEATTATAAAIATAHVAHVPKVHAQPVKAGAKAATPPLLSSRRSWASSVSVSPNPKAARKPSAAAALLLRAPRTTIHARNVSPVSAVKLLLL